MSYNPFNIIINWFNTVQVLFFSFFPFLLVMTSSFPFQQKAKGMLVSMGLAALLLFIMSLTQVSQKTDTSVLTESQWDNFCTDDYVQYTRPFQFMQNVGNSENGPCMSLARDSQYLSLCYFCSLLLYVQFCSSLLFFPFFFSFTFSLFFVR